MFWREVKRTRKGVEVREECVKDGNGRVLSEENEVCERFIYKKLITVQLVL